MTEIALPTLRCYRCSYEWTPRKTPVGACPECRSVHFASLRKPSKATIARLWRRLSKLPPPSFEGSHPRPKTKAEVERRREKDELLVRSGMRPSVLYGR